MADEGRPTLACFLLVTIIFISDSSNPLRLYPVLYLPARLDEPEFLNAIMELEFFDGEALVRSLAAAGRSLLEVSMRAGMGNLEVVRFAEVLLLEAEDLAAEHDESQCLPKAPNQREKGRKPNEADEQSLSTYGELVAGMRDAAAWYAQVGVVDCAVEPS